MANGMKKPSLQVLLALFSAANRGVAGLDGMKRAEQQQAPLTGAVEEDVAKNVQ